MSTSKRIIDKTQQVILHAQETIRRSQETLRVSREVQADRERAEGVKIAARVANQEV